MLIFFETLLDCGSRCHRFDPGMSPQLKKRQKVKPRFLPVQIAKKGLLRLSFFGVKATQPRNPKTALVFRWIFTV
jgi:hypothetical protein